MMRDKKIKVSVCIGTYNQEDYLSQAVESALAQKVNFPIEIIIGEDCSSDGTRDICREYERKFPSKIKVVYHESNKGLIANYVAIMQAARGEFVAPLDGDDYWIDPEKLQKQVAFLESNSEYGLVHTNKKMLSDGVLYDGEADARDQTFEALLLSNFITNSTVVFRKSAADAFLDNLVPLAKERGWEAQDYPLWLHISTSHKLSLMDAKTIIYRVLPDTLSRHRSLEKAYRFDRSVADIKNFFYQGYRKTHSTSIASRMRFHEMMFHARKRMLLDYGWLARGEALRLLLRNPLSYFYVVARKIQRMTSGKSD